MKTLIIFSFMWLLFTVTLSAQVAINNNGSLSDPSAGLDVKFSDKGLLIPRLALAQTSSASPVTSPAVSLLIYNTQTVNDVTPGYYYWSGTQWVRLIAVPESGSENYIQNQTSADQAASFRITGNGIFNGGNVGIGTTDPETELEVIGSFKITDGTQGEGKILTSDANGQASWQISELTELTASTQACPGPPVIVSTGNSPSSVAVSGNYAYVVNNPNGTMFIYDVSNPASPGIPVEVYFGYAPVSVAVSGNYAYVVDFEYNQMFIFDVSNPASPGTPVIANTGSCPTSVAVSGNYAYVVNYMHSNMYIYDVSNPASPGTPVIVNTGAYPVSVAVSGNYAYVVNSISDNMYIYDVSNPASPGTPVIVSTGGSPNSVAVSGNYAYVVNDDDDNMYIYDVSNPASPGTPVIVGTGDRPRSVAVSGNYAYVVNLISNNMYIYNVSNPASPGIPFIMSAGNNPRDVAVSGNYAYVVNDDLKMYIYEVSVSSRQNLILQDGNVIMVTSPWNILNENTYNSNLGNVGIGTTSPKNKLDVEGGAVIGATYSGTNTAPSNGLLVQGNVGIGKTAAAEKLDVMGNVNLQNSLFLSNGTRIAGMRHDANDRLYVYNDNTTAGSNGVYLLENGQSWTSYSDARLKKDIEPMTGILNNVCKLSVKRFHMISDPQDMKKRMGFIAQDVRQLFPDLVCTQGEYFGLSYSDFGVLSIEAIKELRAEKDTEIAELKLQNQDLKSINEALKKLIESLQPQIDLINGYLGVSSAK